MAVKKQMTRLGLIQPYRYRPPGLAMRVLAKIAGYEEER